MLDYFLQFLGIAYDGDLAAETVETLLPVIIVVVSVFSLYLFITFFQFILNMLHRGKQ